MYKSVCLFSSNCGPIWLYPAVPFPLPLPNVTPVALKRRLVSDLYSLLLAQFFTFVFLQTPDKAYIQFVPLATEPGISLIILTPMKILQRNLNRSRFIVWEMKRNASLVRFKFRCNILISGKIIKEMPGSVASGTLYIYIYIYIYISSQSH